MSALNPLAAGREVHQINLRPLAIPVVDLVVVLVGYGPVPCL